MSDFVIYVHRRSDGLDGIGCSSSSFYGPFVSEEAAQKLLQMKGWRPIKECEGEWILRQSQIVYVGSIYPSAKMFGDPNKLPSVK